MVTVEMTYVHYYDLDVKKVGLQWEILVTLTCREGTRQSVGKVVLIVSVTLKTFYYLPNGNVINGHADLLPN